MTDFLKKCLRSDTRLSLATACITGKERDTEAPAMLSHHPRASHFSVLFSGRCVVIYRVFWGVLFKKSVKTAVPDDGNPLGAVVLTKLVE